MKLNPEQINALNKYRKKLMQNVQEKTYIQKHIKRDDYGRHYEKGADLESFISELVGQLVGGVIELSSTASRGSSSFNKFKSSPPIYGSPVFHSVSFIYISSFENISIL
jgi:hypothetical protein